MAEATFDFGAGPVPARRHLNPDGSVGGWVADTAKVADTAFVGPAARVFDIALVLGNARVTGRAGVRENARVSDAPMRGVDRTRNSPAHLRRHSLAPALPQRRSHRSSRPVWRRCPSDRASSSVTA